MRGQEIIVVTRRATRMLLNMGRPMFCCPGGTIEHSPAFQRWVGRQKVTSPEGTDEVQSRSSSFSRPFGTYVPCGMFPGVKTPHTFGVCFENGWRGRPAPPGGRPPNRTSAAERSEKTWP